MSVKFSQRKAWEGRMARALMMIATERLTPTFHHAFFFDIVWSGGLDCKVYQWDFSKGKPLDILSTSKSGIRCGMMITLLLY